MVSLQPASLDSVFHALADQTRRDILIRLRSGPQGMTGLCKAYDMSLPGLLKHVKVLEQAGLAVSVKKGRVRQVEAKPENLRLAGTWINHYSNFWDDALNRFAEILAEDVDVPRSVDHLPH